jgi:hypothetical protein
METVVVLMTLTPPGPEASPDDVLAPIRDDHLRACCDQAEDEPWWDMADVLYHARPATAAQVLGRLSEHPGCAVCVGVSDRGRLLIAGRCGTRLLAVHSDRPDAAAYGDQYQCAWIASAAHAWMSAGHRLETLRALRGPHGRWVWFDLDG